MCIETVKQSKQGMLCTDRQIHKQKYKHEMSNTKTNINDSTGNWVKIPVQKQSVEALSTHRFKPTHVMLHSSLCAKRKHTLCIKAKKVLIAKVKS